MNESEWLAYTDPAAMVSFLRGSHDRKLRLFFCACARTIWTLIQDPLHRSAIEAGELLADGMADLGLVAAIRQELCPGPGFTGNKLQAAAYGAICEGFPVWAISDVADVHAAQAIARARADGRLTVSKDTLSEIRREQADLIRDIFGDPFRPAAFDPRWRTTEVRALARGIYEDRAFDRLPILADALMNAGCDDEQLIGHCRTAGPHVRGCWAVDLALVKE